MTTKQKKKYMCKKCGYSHTWNNHKKSYNNKIYNKKKKNNNIYIRSGPFPDSVTVWLKYQDITQKRNNVGVQDGSWRYRMNNAYDPDPLVGSGSVSGFTEWINIYQSYRVYAFTYKIQLVNLESFPLGVCTAPSLIDLGNNYSNSSQIGEMNLGRTNVLSEVGGNDKCIFKGGINLSKFLGTKQYLYDDNYAALTGTSPTTTIYFNIGFFNNNNSLVNGIGNFCFIKYLVHFYNKKFFAI